MDAPSPTSSAMFPLPYVAPDDLKQLRASWFWFVLLGLLLIFLGMFALGHSLMASLATMVVYAYFLLIGGGFYIVGAFFCRGWGGFFLALLTGILYLAVGFIVLAHPGEAILLYTLLLAVFFFVEGLFRMLAALFGQFHNWGWVFLSGLITLALGLMIWRQWPLSGLWVIGAFIGVNLMVNGVSYLLVGLKARTLPA